MAKILVTGGAGMIGSRLVERLVREGHYVTVADNLWRGKIDNLRGNDGVPIINLNEQFHRVDLQDRAACLAVTKGVEVVFHLADIVAGINFVFANQLFLWRTNVLINTNVLDAVRSNGVEKYVYVGTACSYPKHKQMVVNPPPLREEEVYPAEPESAYGWGKLMGEYEAELARETGDVDVGILRLHNVYGPGSELDPAKSQVIPALCRKAILYPHEPFVVWGSGRQRRAFVYVDDVVNALTMVIKKGMNQGAIQIGPSTSTSIREIAEHVVKLSGKDIDIAYDQTKPEGDVDRAADWNKANNVLGWSPTVDIAEGLARTYDWCARSLQRKEQTK